MFIKKIGNHDLPIPERQTKGAAGYDLQASDDYILNANERKLISTGYAWHIDDGLVGIIKDRSSMAYKYGLSTMAGVIDSDYRGEVKVLLHNTLNVYQTIKKGDRIAQMVVVPHYSDKLQLIDDLDDTSRGSGGFGSTGK